MALMDLNPDTCSSVNPGALVPSRMPGEVTVHSKGPHR